MWYVKLLGGIPALIWVALAIAKLGFEKGWFVIEFSIIGVILGSITSSMWICGICYLLLWVLSLVWALPIKHKIKKERNQAKAEKTRSKKRR